MTTPTPNSSPTTAPAGQGPRPGEEPGVGAPGGETTSSELINLLPHRPPFVWVDAVDVYEPGEKVEARYHVTGDEPFLAGHFPGNPVFPGVIQLEALAQAGALTLLADPRYAGKLPLFGGVDEVRFRRVVRPGDVMKLDFTIEKLSGRGGWGRGRASVDGEVCCEGRLMFVMGPKAG